MSVRPALVTVRRPSDRLELDPAAFPRPAAKPSPKPEPFPDPDDDDMVARDARPPLPAGVGHYPPKLPSQSVDDFPLPKARERSISKSVRIPVSLLDQLEAVCRERQIEFSALVLHYIAGGLRRPFVSEDTRL